MADILVRNREDNGIVQRYTDNGDGTWSLASTAGNPSSAAGKALTPQSTPTATDNIILKSGAGNLYGYNIVTGATAGYLMVFDALTVPADGTVAPKICIPIAANTGLDRSYDVPRRFTTGIVLVFSSTGPFTKTSSATAFLGGSAL